ncbi:MAG: peptidoglycan-binding protein [Cyanobacteria bacterium P01_A01_bin.123]
MGHSFPVHRILKTVGLTLTLASCWGGSSWVQDGLNRAIAAEISPVPVAASVVTQANRPPSDRNRQGDQNAQITPTPILTLGQRGEAVERLQQQLQIQGYDLDTVDGIFGPATLTAVEAFQEDQNLEVDGIVGAKTWQQLVPGQPLSLPSTTALFGQAVVWIPTSFGQQPLLLPGQDTNPPSALWLLLMPAVPLLGGGYFYLKQRVRELIKARSQSVTPNPKVPESNDAKSGPWISYFPLAGLLVASVVSFGVYVTVRTSLIGPSVEQLGRAADLKQSELTTWFDRQTNAVLDTAVDPALLPDLKILLQQAGSSDVQATAYSAISQYVAELQTKAPGQQDIALLTNGGIVVFSADDRRVGQYQPLQNTTTYFTADQVDRVEPNLYVSPLTNELLITLATPVVDETGQRIGVLAVDLNLTDLDERIRQPINLSEGDRNYLGDTGETYLVGRSSLIKSEFVSKRQDIDVQFQTGVSSRGIDNAINRQEGEGLYLNYAKTPVIGVYRWVGDQNLALLAEINQAEVFNPARQLAKAIFFGGVAFTGVGSLLLWGIRRRAQNRLPIPQLNPETNNRDLSESLKQSDR